MVMIDVSTTMYIHTDIADDTLGFALPIFYAHVGLV